MKTPIFVRLLNPYNFIRIILQICNDLVIPKFQASQNLNLVKMSLQT